MSFSTLFTPSNLLSFSRVPLAFLLLADNPFYRFLAIALAMLSDSLDGYIARRYHMITRFGTMLDPMTDKFFVVFALCVFVKAGNLGVGQAIALLSRDVALLAFGGYLALQNRFGNFHFQSIISGKISTFFQFIVLLCFIFNFSVPYYAYYGFIFLGICAFFELYRIDKRSA